MNDRENECTNEWTIFERKSPNYLPAAFTYRLCSELHLLLQHLHRYLSTFPWVVALCMHSKKRRRLMLCAVDTEIWVLLAAYNGSPTSLALVASSEKRIVALLAYTNLRPKINNLSPPVIVYTVSIYPVYLQSLSILIQSKPLKPSPRGKNTMTEWAT